MLSREMGKREWVLGGVGGVVLVRSGPSLSSGKRFVTCGCIIWRNRAVCYLFVVIAGACRKEVT